MEVDAPILRIVKFGGKRRDTLTEFPKFVKHAPKPCLVKTVVG